jgi:hypothetical protein
VAEIPPVEHGGRINGVGSDFSEINDLCYELSQDPALDSKDRNLVGTILADQLMFRLYATGAGSEGQCPTFLKFQDALKPRGHTQTSSFKGLSKAQRLKLARDLALGFIHLESTPWEEPDVWNMCDNKDIILYFPEGTMHPGYMEFYISRRFSSDRDLADLLENSPSDRHPYFVNASMWKLTLLLIELCLNRTIERVQLPGSEFLKAHSLMKTRHIEEKFGTPYKEAVKFCLTASTCLKSPGDLHRDFKANVIDKIDQTLQFFSGSR